jgi:hypothetical protein
MPERPSIDDGPNRPHIPSSIRTVKKRRRLSQIPTRAEGQSCRWTRTEAMHRIPAGRTAHLGNPEPLRKRKNPKVTPSKSTGTENHPTRHPWRPEPKPFPKPPPEPPPQRQAGI